MSQNIIFQDTSITIHHINGQPYIKGTDIAKALGYTSDYAVSDLYNRHKDEFDEEMSQPVNLTVSGNLARKARVFNREGAWTIAMLAKTPKAAQFRKWIRQVLKQHIDETAQPAVRSIEENGKETSESGIINDMKLKIQSVFDNMLSLPLKLDAYDNIKNTQCLLVQTDLAREAASCADTGDALQSTIRGTVYHALQDLRDILTTDKATNKTATPPAISSFLERTSRRLSTLSSAQ